MTRVLAVCILAGISLGVCRAEELSIVRSIRECLRANSSLVCLKERALRVIDEAVFSDQPIKLTDYVDVVRDPAYQVNTTDEHVLPSDVEERSLKLNDLITRRVDQFFESRTVKFNLANVFEGRGKKGGKKGGGLLMMGGLAMAGMMAQMFMGKVAFMAGAALMISKMALLLSSIIGLKKLVGGGGGGDHVVYTASDSHGGGGWHRSLNPEDEPGVLAYRSHNSHNNNV